MPTWGAVGEVNYCSSRADPGQVAGATTGCERVTLQRGHSLSPGWGGTDASPQSDLLLEVSPRASGWETKVTCPPRTGDFPSPAYSRSHFCAPTRTPAAPQAGPARPKPPGARPVRNSPLPGRAAFALSEASLPPAPNSEGRGGEGMHHREVPSLPPPTPKVVGGRGCTAGRFLGSAFPRRQNQEAWWPRPRRPGSHRTGSGFARRGPRCLPEPLRSLRAGPPEGDRRTV